MAAFAALAIVAAVVTLRGAGDLLRGSATAGSTAPVGTPAVTVTTATTQMRANAQDRLARTTQALQAVQAMQAAARALAVTGPNNLGPDPRHVGQTLPNVPDGLAVGGLAVATGSGWTGASLPAQTVTGGLTTVTITQSAAQAILNWTTFNIGKNTTLAFDQRAGGADIGQWVVFNQINDPSGSPAQILGSITTGGQVYVINRNGIIFGGTSQVNTHALVASA
ncbi:MAG: filamentous hemagglutinin N-terminal domain-containing protein, partial [Verrucomicrobiota bacterium]